ncbi:GTP-binding protein [Streptomyces sp. B1866]|uniref:CobW family GTP-binding protein n=1 Tax=Streptomyces sp. B1866 TaxID=3075431 RepID=UPI00288E5F15|nr:GTP-binding protein [Streptomyces sp. B1866]MDT3397115.1 GTP-binding protein [Streptomyces sp. B1866]
MAHPRIPVVLVTGFLGSGKTTLLNHLLRGGTDTRIGVIVNDFGSVNIDALTVVGQVDAMIPIENGCLCCAADASELDEMLRRLTDPAARIDVVVVEASGLAEPPSMIRTLLTSSDARVLYGGLVQVVDAAEFRATRERHPELDRHLRAADVVVVNKADRVAEAGLREVLETVRRLSPGTPVVAARHGRVDPDFLFDRPRRAPGDSRYRQLSLADLCAPEDGHDHGAHLHAAYQSLAFDSDRPLHPRRLLEFFETRPDGLYRVKGFVRLAGDARTFAVHAVGSFLRFQPRPPVPGEPDTTRLVLIGTGLDADALTRRLAACAEPAPETVDARELLGVLRFVRDEGGAADGGPRAAPDDLDADDLDADDLDPDDLVPEPAD